MKFPFTGSDKMVYAIDGVSKFMLHFIMDLHGQLRPSLLAQAIDLALTKSPILKSVARLRSFAPYWEVLDDLGSSSILRVDDLTGEPDGENAARESLEDYINEYIDITQGPPVRFLLMQRAPERWTFVVKVHHCALDPVGMTHLVEDIQEYYGQLLGGEFIPPPEPMEDRGRWLLFKSVPLALWGRMVWVGFTRLLRHRLERRRTVRCHVRFSAPRPDSSAISYRSVRFAGKDFRSLRARAKSLGMTVNDVAIAALCRAIRQWNRDQEPSDGMYSVILPADVRRYVRKQGAVPRIMSNYVGGTLITVPVERVTTLEETAQYVAEETRFIRNHHDGLRHNLGLPLMSLVPPQWLRRKLQRFQARHPSQFGPTAIVAYLGKIDRLLSVFPDCEIKSIEGVGTGFYPVGFDVVVLSYGREYTVTFSYLKGACTNEEIDRFVTLFFEEVLSRSGKIQVAAEVGYDVMPETVGRQKL